MSHLVLSRKYRPQSFDELVGQTHVARILRNAIGSGRIGHAYLFVGPRGVGKTTTARIFARALNCTGSGEGTPGTPAVADPCGTCASCRDVTAGSDLDVVEMDAASNNHVEDVRRLREQVGYATVRSRYRIWIVDEVHMLSLPAFNAFLKTLEEPPERVKFVFCTTEEHKLPDTFRSRCQRIEFRPIDPTTMSDRLHELAGREGVETEPGLCEEIAAAASGGLRDAESMLEQLMAAVPVGPLRREDLDALAGRAPRSLLDAVLTAVDAGDAAGALDAVDAALASGCKPGVLVEQWLERLREALVAAARGGTSSSEGRQGVPRLARAIDVLLEKRMHLRAGADGVLVCQVLAVELARLPDARDLDALLAALETAPSSQPRPAAVVVAPAPPQVPPPQVPPPQVPPPQGPPQPGSTDRPAARTRARPVVEAARSGTGAARPGTTGLPDVREHWDALLAQTAARDGRLGEALRRSRLVGTSEGRLVLEIPGGDVMTRSTLERRESMLALREITEQVLGVPLGARVVEGEPPRTEAPVAPPDEHPDVQRVKEVTGGRLLDVEHVARPRRGSSKDPA